MKYPKFSKIADFTLAKFKPEKEIISDKVAAYSFNDRYSQGKTGVSVNSVQEWLVGCF